MNFEVVVHRNFHVDHVPPHVHAGSLVSRISKGNRFLTVQQAVAFSHIAHMPGCTSHGVHQTGLCIGADMGLHAKVPLVALFAGVHLGVAGFVFVLGGIGRGNQLGVHDRASFEQ